ncbi:hypothetical protein DPEC_G00314090 [Dallia pectoralis]|uniref:Uncharacterized protein n=1 Tax=Dallia pectoralis TaxID=75939 RepID=A0ACC2FBX6_DALPE|nr:hypothetical protein DPEC_G00314090 [Dallia pectoralis]
MCSRLPRITPGYRRYLQTQAAESGTQKALDLVTTRLALVLGALGIGVCGYSSRQLALHHRPSARALTWMDVRSTPIRGNASLSTELSRHQGVGQDVQPPAFAGEKVP